MNSSAQYVSFSHSSAWKSCLPSAALAFLLYGSASAGAFAVNEYSFIPDSSSQATGFLTLGQDPKDLQFSLDGSFDPDGPGIIEPIDLSSAYWLGAGLNVSLSGLSLLDTGSIYFKPSFEFKQFF